MEISEILNLIESSFSERSLNGGISERQAHEIDDKRIPLSLGRKRIELDITDDWRRLASVDDTCFFEYDSKAWKYYLPAAFYTTLIAGENTLDHYLKFLLLPTSSNNSDTFDFKLWTPMEFVQSWEFNEAQAHCIAIVLQYLSVDFDDEERMQLDKWLKQYGKAA